MNILYFGASHEPWEEVFSFLLILLRGGTSPSLPGSRDHKTVTLVVKEEKEEEFYYNSQILSQGEDASPNDFWN